MTLSSLDDQIENQFYLNLKERRFVRRVVTLKGESSNSPFFFQEKKSMVKMKRPKAKKNQFQRVAGMVKPISKVELELSRRFNPQVTEQGTTLSPRVVEQLTDLMSLLKKHQG